ncbi:MAG TPA: orotidine-5'-phosphate decarboxylase [Candidatus Lokiarchaeia archaeon]|nr:orotidine-5'-phosphate decarboxylase [Candidatus Lokiarchaeia archaeon]
MDELTNKISEKESRVCLGLDPSFQGPASIPQFLLETFDNAPSEAILEFNTRILEAVQDIVPVVKPQLAFYMANDALDALKKTISKAKQLGLMVILDAKFNDIGNTSEAYATTAFDVFGADAVTVNGYLGTDCIEPFLKNPDKADKAIFVLVKTSNKSSGEFQDLFSLSAPDVPLTVPSATFANETLERNYVQMARLVSTWNEQFTSPGEEFGKVGVVIGATYPEQLKQLRSLLPGAFILIPGYGAQGATAVDVKHGFTSKGTGAIVNSSRALLYAYALSKTNACEPENFEAATRKETEQMRVEINAALGEY